MSKKNESKTLERVPSLKKQTMQFCEDLVGPSHKSPVRKIRSPERRQKNTPKAVNEKKRKKKNMSETGLIPEEEAKIEEIIQDPRRKLVAQELLDTERTYVNQLGALIGVCYLFYATMHLVQLPISHFMTNMNNNE